MPESLYPYDQHWLRDALVTPAKVNVPGDILIMYNNSFKLRDPVTLYFPKKLPPNLTPSAHRNLRMGLRDHVPGEASLPPIT